MTGSLLCTGEGKMFSPGNLRATFDNNQYEHLLSHYIGEKYTLRYTGGMVPDVFQIIVKEKGVFTNVTSPSTKAKLRILFEVAPLALLVRHPPHLACAACCFMLCPSGSASSGGCLSSIGQQHGAVLCTLLVRSFRPVCGDVAGRIKCHCLRGERLELCLLGDLFASCAAPMLLCGNLGDEQCMGAGTRMPTADMRLRGLYRLRRQAVTPAAMASAYLPLTSPSTSMISEPRSAMALRAKWRDLRNICMATLLGFLKQRRMCSGMPLTSRLSDMAVNVGMSFDGCAQEGRYRMDSQRCEHC